MPLVHLQHLCPRCWACVTHCPNLCTSPGIYPSRIGKCASSYYVGAAGSSMYEQLNMSIAPLSHLLELPLNPNTLVTVLWVHLSVCLEGTYEVQDGSYSQFISSTLGSTCVSGNRIPNGNTVKAWTESPIVTDATEMLVI